MLKFQEFVDKKEREAIKQLSIVKKLLESQEMKVKNYLKEDDPYIFLVNPLKNTFFDGIRIYKIGDSLAFRVQKEEKTHPFGTAYPLDIEEMFNDLLSDHHKPEDAGKKVINAVTNEVKRFFEKSYKAEKDLRSIQLDREPWNKVVIKSNDFGVDYSNLTYAKN